MTCVIFWRRRQTENYKTLNLHVQPLEFATTTPHESCGQTSSLPSHYFFKSSTILSANGLAEAGF